MPTISTPIVGDFPRDAAGKRRSCAYCDRGAFLLIGTSSPMGVARRPADMPELEPRCLHHLQGPNSLSEEQRRVAELSRRAKDRDPAEGRSKR